MTNLAYKHLESKLKIGELTVLQWAGLLAGVLAALGWGMYLSPLGTYLTLISAVYVGGVPAAAAFLASVTEFDLWLHLRAMAAWRRAGGHFQPGAGSTAQGYRLTNEDRAQQPQDLTDTVHLDLSTLWED